MVPQDKLLQLHDLAAAGNLAGLQAALAAGADLQARDAQGCSALHFAADRGQLEALEVLLAAGVDVEAKDEDGQTPLHYAALCGNEVVCTRGCWCYRIVRLLLFQFAVSAGGRDFTVCCQVTHGQTLSC
jgi:ankyrin repeat protein